VTEFALVENVIDLMRLTQLVQLFGWEKLVHFMWLI